MSSDGVPHPLVPLRDVVRIHHGFAFKGKYFADSPPGDVLLTPGNFRIGGGFTWHKRKYYDGPVEEQYVLLEGTLLISMTDLSKSSDTLGSPAVCPSAPTSRLLHNQRLGRVEVIAPERVDPGFLYAALRTERYRRQVVATATGTTVKHTSPTRIGEALIPLPEVPEQRRIAAVLDTFDGKIDSNRRLTASLHETANTLFTARYIDFVGVDDLEPSSIGAIPRGWRVVPFSHAVEINPRVRIPRGEVRPFIEMAAVAPWATRPSRLVQREAGGGCKYEPRDTLMARITGCIEHGKGAFLDFIDQAGTGSTEFLVLRAKPPLTPEAVFFLSRWEKLRAHAITNMTGSSGRQRVATNCFDDFEVAIPPDEASVADAADFLAAAMRKSRALWRETTTLTALRDELLPKLVSGDLRVPAVSSQDDGRELST